MSDPIREGDTVYVAYPTKCCNSNRRLGAHFMVTRLVPAKGWCSYCGRLSQEPYVAEGLGEHITGIRLSRLRRIPPLSELETQHTENEVTA